jgi:hypothetical protein
MSVSHILLDRLLNKTVCELQCKTYDMIYVIIFTLLSADISVFLFGVKMS